MKFLFLTLLLLVSPFIVTAQNDEEDKNLISNGGFEEMMEKLRRYGQLEAVKDWYSPTEEKADAYSSSISSKYVQAPDNYRGQAEPYEGANYAGIQAYSYRGKEPRTYITTRLKKNLETKKLYCVKMQISLAELSTYAVNNVGFLVTKGKPDGKSGQIISSDFRTAEFNPVVNKKDGWMGICQTIQGKGGESYLTIGNFAPDAQTQTERVAATSGMTAPQEPIAYYYIDDVSVTPVATPGDCSCAGIPESKLIYSSSNPVTDEMTISEKLNASTIYFYQYNKELTSTAKKNLDNVIGYMKQNPMMKIEVVAHSDVEEVKLAEKEGSIKDLAQQRANAVLKYFIDNGVERGKLVLTMKDDKDPDSPLDTPISLSKNRRVEFRIAK